ncbi:DNA internalization-related competence protein ComEC/Rec2 [Niallia nealsonii]|uniref:DNA internalization-related competence protein ComEC/Rec2 n=1 Tax=Niallia nealsonii TaxID=115979 RepID=A0A2N0Z4R5_9BACI|nr:DNA internalization-related competence protein ComEC/Rec2 [Niallia nealsonii]PKG24500.1 DNA internalization-related competence protein ComEC/Rec2 [Niallia nealsonii]
MKNRILYFSISGLFAYLCVFLHLYFFLLVFFLYTLWLFFSKKFTLIFLCSLLFIFGLFFLRADLENRLSFSRLLPTTTKFTLLFLEEPTVDGDMLKGVAKETKTNEKIHFSYKIKSEVEKEYVEKLSLLGRRCLVIGELEKPASARNEFNFDYKKYLWNHSIYWNVKADTFIDKNCSDSSVNLIDRIKTERQSGIKWIQEKFSKETKGVAIALIFGDRQLMDEGIQTAFQRLGIIHLLAISGSHIIILIAIFYFLMIRFGITKEKAITIMLIILPVYAVLTGLSPSIIRAVATSVLVLLKLKVKKLRSFPSIDLLSFVFLFYIFFQPKVIFDVGFILSFTVCLFLLLSSSIFINLSSNIMYRLLFPTFVSEFSVLPIILSYFYEIPTLSLLANVLYIPFYSIIVLPYLLIVFVLSFFVPFMIDILLLPMDVILSYSNRLIIRLSSFPFSTIILGKPSNILLFFYLLAPIIFFYQFEKNNSSSRIYFLFIPIILVLMQVMGNYYHSEGEVSFIDVGQGDSILIKLPQHQGIYLIDTGGTIEFDKEKWQKRNNPYEVGKDTLVPFLKSKGIATIDKLILTHGDLDHIGGSLAVVSSIRVKEIVFPKTNLEPGKEEKEILQLAAQKRIPVSYVKGGQSFLSGDTRFYILSPLTENIENKNDASIVIKAKIGGLNWLFTGDLEESGEQLLLSRYPNLKTDILKIGHHGSKTSTSESFLQKIEPKAAIISAGKNNRYGHPHKAVIDRLQKAHITTWRTDLNGEITYKFSKRKGTFFMQLP